MSSRVLNRVGGVLVSVFTSSAIDRGFKLPLGQTEDCKISIGCFAAKNAAVRRKRKDWLSRNQGNVSGWSDMAVCGLMFQ